MGHQTSFVDLSACYLLSWETKLNLWVPASTEVIPDTRVRDVCACLYPWFPARDFQYCILDL